MNNVNYSNLEGWRHRRIDKRTENYWNRIAEERPLNSFEEHQREWNFREIEYNHEPSNNGLDMYNPAFAFDKKLVKFLRCKECDIIDGHVVNIRYL